MCMMRYVVVILAFVGVVPANAQFVVNHEPYPFGGSGSDTALPSIVLPFTWQASADDFALTAAATVTHVNWWGFYIEGTGPLAETFRIRLFSASPGNGLPGEAMFEEVFQNPERVDTGRTIAIGGRPHEYRFHVALGTPANLGPDVAYWLEIAQLGDGTSGFQWELSRVETNSYAFQNNLFPEWRRTTASSDLAFQLVVPEPITASLLLLGLAFAAGLRARGRLNSG